MPTCTFFGHSNTKEEIIPKLQSVLKDLIENEGVDKFYVGNHGFFDHYVRKTLKEFQKRWYPHIRYFVVLAYLPEKNDELSIIDYSDTIYPEGIEKVPKKAAIVWRNEWMIAHSDFVVVNVLHSFGGAARFAALAERKKKTVINLKK